MSSRVAAGELLIAQQKTKFCERLHHLRQYGSRLAVQRMEPVLLAAVEIAMGLEGGARQQGEQKMRLRRGERSAFSDK